MPFETIEEANAHITKLELEATNQTSLFNTLTSSHATLTEQHETIKTTLGTAQVELKAATDASGGSVKAIEDLTKQVGDRDTIIASHVETVKERDDLKVSYQALVDGQITSQKDRLKSVGLTDEQLTDKTPEALMAMEVAIVAARPAGGSVNGSQNGLTGGGAGGTDNHPQDGLEASRQAMAKAKERR